MSRATPGSAALAACSEWLRTARALGASDPRTTAARDAMDRALRLVRSRAKIRAKIAARRPNNFGESGRVEMGARALKEGEHG